MTTNEIIAYYCDLLIIQYFQKTKAYVTIDTIVRPVVMDQLPLTVQDGFDIETAVGAQLDIIAKYVGVNRNGFGFNRAPITLSDSDFRSLIRMGIIRNMAGSSLATIQEFLFMFFPGQLFVFDYANMQMSYLMSSAIGSQDLAAMMVSQDLLPKPMGVQLSVVVYIPTLELFGMNNYLQTIANIFPFNTYADYQTDWPWLSYSDGIIF